MSPSKKNTTVTSSPHGQDKAQLRTRFLATCRQVTKRIQRPIVDSAQVKGHPNPTGLGNTRRFSETGSFGQSSVIFDRLAIYHLADKRGHSLYGGAEYGVVQSPEAEAVGAKFAKLHTGAGAVICSSGLAAISTTIEAFTPKAIIIPECIYFPAYRYMQEMKRVQTFVYSPSASAADVIPVLEAVARDFAPHDIMLYLEAPGSGTFEIPDIKGIAGEAKKRGIRTVIDNTWASHIRFMPLKHGIDIAIQATTKYEGGYGDTPSGVVIARKIQDVSRLRRQLRNSGHGAVSPQTCMRLYHRVDSAEQRLDQHASTAQQLMQWFADKPFVSRILCPAWANDPHHARFQEYFGKGNGLFTVVFKENLSRRQMKSFVDALLLFRVAESWGGHVSLVLPVHPSHRDPASLPKGTMFRFHAGLEDARDLINDLDQAARVFIGNRIPSRKTHKANIA